MIVNVSNKLTLYYNSLQRQLNTFIHNTHTNINYYLGNAIIDINGKRHKNQSSIDNQIKRCVTSIVGEESLRNLTLKGELRIESEKEKDLNLIKLFNNKMEKYILSSNLHSNMLEILKRGLISGGACLECGVNSKGLFTKNHMLYTPIGVLFDYATSSITMEDCESIFIGKIVSVSELINSIPNINQEQIELINRYKSVNLGDNILEFNNQSLESLFSNDNSYYNESLNQIRIIEAYMDGMLYVTIPTSSVTRSRNSTYDTENLLIIYQERREQNFTFFSPEIENSQYRRIENRFISPINCARGLQYFLNELLQKQLSQISTSVSAVIFKGGLSNDGVEKIKNLSSGDLNILNVHKDAVDPLTFAKSPTIDPVTLQLIAIIKDSILSAFGLSSGVLGEYEGGNETYALTALKTQSVIKNIASMKRNYLDCYKASALKIIKLGIMNDISLSNDLRNIFLNIFNSEQVEFKLVESFVSPISKSLENYMYFKELLAEIPDLPDYLKVHFSPITDKELIYKALREKEEQQLKLQQIQEKDIKLALKEKETDIKKTEAETQKIKKETIKNDIIKTI